ncbi:MAG: hypothetical protein AB7T27_00715 [Kiritimatiellia bacterium]
MKEESVHIYKRCTTCGTAWKDRDSFLSDPSVEFLGYQPFFEEERLGYFLFNHVTECTTTLALAVEDFRNLYDGPVWQTCAYRGPDCPGYCSHLGQDGRCPVKCVCTWVREVMAVLKAWPKKTS